jgi:choloylglycine hydrolase
VLFGRNYDFPIGDALIFVNKTGVAKTATDGDSRNPAKWVSKYGSVTLNQFGRENPTGGMNEMGLVVEQMWLDETEYPKDDTRPTLGTQEWMQYLLELLRRLRSDHGRLKACGLYLASKSLSHQR